MDSFYPKFGEVEMVLVDDDNDFFDPLETNFECEDENEDAKLQLNDAVYEDTQFQLSSFDSRENSLWSENIELNKSVKEKTYRENSQDNNDRCITKTHIVKVEEIHDKHSENASTIVDSSNSSFDDLQNSESFENHFSDDSSDDQLHEVKVDPKMILHTNSTNSDETDTKPDGIIVEQVKPKTKTEGKLKIKLKTKRKINTQAILKEECDTKASTSTSDTDTKREHGNKRRQYSKRNEIPKQAKHNEAYDKKLLFCKICSIQFDRSPAFTEHMRSSHSIDKPFECFICSKPYRICSLLAEHIR